MVDATVSFAIEKLNEFITQQVNIRIEVRDGIRWLRDELSYLQLTVRAAEAIPEITDLIRLWINSIKDVANDAVIILERFGMLDEEHAHQEEGFMDCMQRYICFCKKEANLYDIGKEIVCIRARIDEIKIRREEHGINNILATQAVPKKKRTLLRVTSFHDQDNMVGFEDEFKTLLDELGNKDPSLRFISIHGMGGSGKSTLASKLYHSPELSHFTSRAWVCVSKDYNTIDVLRRIIKSFGDDIDSLKNMEYVDLLRHLRKLLANSKNYLAVIDDIWEIKAWQEIQEAFTDNMNGSRIIITTRSKDVAQAVDGRSFVHKLRFLRDDESWKLFCKKANPTSNLENLGMEMVRKCSGLPLAIVVLSGLLLHKNSFIDWSGVQDHLWRNLKGKSAEIKDILNLSFADLSLEMRDCFLYLARFPEDHAFRIDELMRLWIAEELISKDQEREGVIMEDVAEDYLNELINRNIIQISRFQLNREVLECRIHGLVRDLATEKAREKLLVGIFDSSKQSQSPVSSLHGQTRHAICNGIGEYLKSVGPSSDDKKLRSLAIISSSGRLESEEVKLISTRFRNLKVLDMAGVQSNGIPKEIGELVFLNFLSLMRGGSYGQPLVIPPSIGNLKKLQTLCGPSDSKYEYPYEIGELKQLRHLIFAPSRMSLNISSHQTKLHTVRTIGYENWIHIDTVKFTNLHTLSITDASMEDQEGVVYTLDSIANLTSLQTFDLELRTIAIPTIKPLSCCKHLKNVFLWGKMKDPWQLRFLPDSVTNLRLIGCEFTQDPMPALESLLNLTTLYVEKIYAGEKMVCSQDSFSSLQYFKIEDLCNLKEWQVEDGALSSLKGFQIDYCYKLKIVPQQLKCIPPIPEIYDM